MNFEDRAFLDAEFLFGGGTQPDLSVFTESSRVRYLDAIQQRSATADRDAEFANLRSIFEAQRKADLARIHPSWVARALQDEPRSIRRAVLRCLPEPSRRVVALELAMTSEELSTDSTEDNAFYRSLALSQSLSRLVGDVASVEGEAPVVVALTAIEPSAAPRMIRRIGIAKWAITAIPLPDTERVELERWKAWFDALGPWEPRFRDTCQAELARLKTLDSKAVNRLGFSTFSRLLRTVDSRRARWTIQQIPYSTAKTLQTIMNHNEADCATLLGEESRLFQATWRALWEEGAISRAWPSEEVG